MKRITVIVTTEMAGEYQKVESFDSKNYDGLSYKQLDQGSYLVTTHKNGLTAHHTFNTWHKAEVRESGEDESTGPRGL